MFCLLWSSVVIVWGICFEEGVGWGGVGRGGPGESENRKTTTIVM